MTDKYDAKTIVDDIFEKRRKDSTILELEDNWWNNFTMWKGDQWRIYVESKSSFRTQIPTQAVPTPVANYVRSSVRDETAIILNKNYMPRIYPNTDSGDDKATAEMGNMLIKDMDLANDEEFMDEKAKATKWMLIFGTSFIRTFPDKDRGEYGFDKKGNIIPSGEVVSEALLPFNVILDPVGDTLRKKRYVGVHSYKDKQWVEDNFGVEITTDGDRERLKYLRGLSRYVSKAGPNKVGRRVPYDSDDNIIDDLVEFREIEFKPTKKFPNGRYIVMANEQVLIDSDKLPISNNKGNNKWRYSITDFHFDKVPGAFWSDSFIHDLLSPQRSINKLDQAQEMNRHSVGKPKLIMPRGTQLEKVNMRGDIYDALIWDPMTTAGIPPKFDSGTALPSSLQKERDVHRATIQNASANPNDVLGGAVPTAGASALLVDVLQESAESSHTPTIQSYFRSLTRVYRNRLLLAKILYTEERTIKVVGPNKELQIKIFKGSNLGNNTDIRLEPATTSFRMKSTEAHTMLNLVQTGMFENDPVTKMDLLKKLVPGLIGDRPNIHATRAEREHLKISESKFKGIFVTEGTDTGRPNLSPDALAIEDDPLFVLDDHAIHYDSHLRKTMSDEFQSWKLKEQRRLIAHTLLHKDAMERKIIEEQKKMLELQMAQKQVMEPPQEEEPEEAQLENISEDQFMGA